MSCTKEMGQRSLVQAAMGVPEICSPTRGCTCSSLLSRATQRCRRAHRRRYPSTGMQGSSMVPRLSQRSLCRWSSTGCSDMPRYHPDNWRIRRASLGSSSADSSARSVRSPEYSPPSSRRPHPSTGIGFRSFAISELGARCVAVSQTRDPVRGSSATRPRTMSAGRTRATGHWSRGRADRRHRHRSSSLRRSVTGPESEFPIRGCRYHSD